MHLVLCNVPPDHADALAKTLVTERLAACVNLTPVRSVYRWNGNVEMDTEVTLMLKVSSERVAALRERLLSLHPYDLPEVLVFDVNGSESHGDYLAWVDAECAPPAPGR